MIKPMQLLAGFVFLQAMLLVTAGIAAPENYCRTIPARSDALDWPSKHAWNLFIMLNHPAMDKKFGRGVPDCTRPFGSPGSTSVWETWRNADSEVYLSDGREPPEWNDTSLPDEKPGKVPQLQPLVGAGRPGILFSPTDGIFHDSGGFGETRLNRSTYEFVRRECLFSRDGQQRYAKAVEDGKKSGIQFPPDSIEVKAAWIDFAERLIPADKQQTYYAAEFQGKKYGLVALHILTKDVPNWFWATFHHKDNPSNTFETPDTFGMPLMVKGTVWENYRPGGTQTDFTLPDGTAAMLSDHFVEFAFQRSSCITCHATATISQNTPLPAAQARALCAMTPTLPALGLDPVVCRGLIGEKAFETGTDKLLMERGVPDPEWFKKDGKPFYLQTDFVYSIPFRGKREASAPPARCLW